MKFMPDSVVALACDVMQFSLYKWATVSHVPIFFYTPDGPICTKGLFKGRNVISLPPYVAAVRDYREDALGPIDVRSEELATFIDYSKGCGKMNFERWRYMVDSNPFYRASFRFGALQQLSHNESMLLGFWESISNTYNMLIN